MPILMQVVVFHLTRRLEDLRKAYEKIYKVRDWAEAVFVGLANLGPGSLLLPLQVFLDGDSDQDGVTWMATTLFACFQRNWPSKWEL